LPLPLIIEYVFEGHQRGYNFTSSTSGYSDDTLKAVWRQAMPRGQGWGAAQFNGARMLKGFPLPSGALALADVVVTDQEDEHGRRGIRRAQVEVLPVEAAAERLRARLASYPPEVQAHTEAHPTLGQWWRILTDALPRLGGDAQVVLARPYTTPDDWQLVEAFVIKVALSRLIPLRRWGRVAPFTTLALEHRDESRLVALPTQRIAPDAPISPILLR
jgi:hypothetical protein